MSTRPIGPLSTALWGLVGLLVIVTASTSAVRAFRWFWVESPGAALVFGGVVAFLAHAAWVSVRPRVRR